MSVGIDGLEGAVDGARGAVDGARGVVDGARGAVDGARSKVNDAHMFQGTEPPRTCECEDVICQQGLHLLRVHCLAVPQYGKRELWGANAD